MWERIKSNEQLYRSLRTFAQAFIGYIASAVVAAASGAELKTVLIGAIAPAIATGIAAAMNNSTNKETESEGK